MVKSRSQLDRLIDAADFDKLNETERAERLIWYTMRLQDRDSAYLPYVKSLFVTANYSEPNLSRLRKNLKAKRLVLSRASQMVRISSPFREIGQKSSTVNCGQ